MCPTIRKFVSLSGFAITLVVPIIEVLANTTDFRCPTIEIRHFCSEEEAVKRESAYSESPSVSQKHKFQIKCIDPCGNEFYIHYNLEMKSKYKASGELDPAIETTAYKHFFSLRTSLVEEDTEKILAKSRRALAHQKAEANCTAGENSLIGNIVDLAAVLEVAKLQTPDDNLFAREFSKQLIKLRNFVYENDSKQGTSPTEEETANINSVVANMDRATRMMDKLAIQRGGGRLGFPDPDDRRKIIWIDPQVLGTLPTLIRELHSARSEIRKSERAESKEVNPQESKECFDQPKSRSADVIRSKLAIDQDLQPLVSSLKQSFVSERSVLLSKLGENSSYKAGFDPTLLTVAPDVRDWNTSEDLCKSRPKSREQESLKQQIKSGLEMVEKAKAQLRQVPPGDSITAVIALGEGKLILDIATSRESDGRTSLSPEIRNAVWDPAEGGRSPLEVGMKLSAKDSERILDFIQETRFQIEFDKQKCGYISPLGSTVFAALDPAKVDCVPGKDKNCPQRNIFSMLHDQCDPKLPFVLNEKF